MPSKTIVFVPGAWHSPLVYSIVAHKLRAAGYGTRFVSLASVSPEKHLADFKADVARIRSAIEKEADVGHEVVLVVHSYGGLPGTEAVKGLSLASRKQAGLKGGVAHIFYCCSFIIPEGKSLSTAFGGGDLPWYGVSEDRTYYVPKTPAETFYNDMPEDEVEAAVAILKAHSYQVTFSELTYAAWKEVPSTYLYCTKDQAIPLQVQRMMVEDFAKGHDINTETVEAGHSPFFSQPHALAAAIRRAAGEVV